MSIQYTLRDWKNLKVRLMLENDKLSNFGSRSQGKRFSYRSIIESFLLSASIKNDTKTIFITCNGLNDAKTTIIHEQNYKTFGVVNLGQSADWFSIKGSSNWGGVNFVDGSFPTE